MRLRVTPVPIPNTMVKTQAADGTSLETVRESRWPPNLKKDGLIAQLVRAQRLISVRSVVRVHLSP